MKVRDAMKMKKAGPWLRLKVWAMRKWVDLLIAADLDSFDGRGGPPMGGAAA